MISYSVRSQIFLWIHKRQPFSDKDEEAIDLVKFQNAYNLSSKMVSVLAEIYDKLINETGV